MEKSLLLIVLILSASLLFSGVCSSKVYKTTRSARAKRESITASSNNFSLTTHRNGFQSLNSHSCFDSSIIVSSVTLIVESNRQKFFLSKVEAKKNSPKPKLLRKFKSELSCSTQCKLERENVQFFLPGRRFMKHYYYYSLSISFSPEIFIRLIIFFERGKALLQRCIQFTFF